MAYKKQNFADGQVIKAENLNAMDDGIGNATEIAEKSVRFEYQNLTNAQKAQVRTNIDALGQSDLESATNAALAKAKASGEFNGADGYTPIKGKDYFTEEDKSEIIQFVINALLKYNGG